MWASSVPIQSNAQLQVCFDWDAATGATNIDLDGACSLFDCNGLMLDCCFYNNLTCFNGALRHSGDSRDGKSNADDEIITVNLAQVPPNTAACVFTWHFFSEGDFSLVETAYVKICVNGKQLDTYTAPAMGHTTTAVVMVLERLQNGVWSMRATPSATAVAPIRTPVDALDLMQAQLNIPEDLRKEFAAWQPKLKVEKGSPATIPPNMTTVALGLGWDSRVDVDSGAIAVKADGTVAKVVYFGDKEGFHGAIHHTGDNTTGEGDGDDEQIIVKLDKIPADVVAIVFCINVYTSGETFADVSGEYCRLLDMTNHHEREFARVDGLDSGSTNGFVFAALTRSTRLAGFWEYHAIGIHGDNMRRCTEMQSLASDWVVANYRKNPERQATAAPPPQQQKQQDGCCLVA